MRPTMVFDPMLQAERTSLAWERTAIVTMITGLLLARHAASLHPLLGLVGIVQVVLGGALLVWTGRRYDDLHGPLRAGVSPVHPMAAQFVGVMTAIFTAFATVIAIALAVR